MAPHNGAAYLILELRRGSHFSEGSSQVGLLVWAPIRMPLVLMTAVELRLRGPGRSIPDVPALMDALAAIRQRAFEGCPALRTEIGLKTALRLPSAAEI